MKTEPSDSEVPLAVVKLPEYYPLHKNSREEIRKLSTTDLDSLKAYFPATLREIIKEFKNVIADKLSYGELLVLTKKMTIEEYKQWQSELFDNDTSVQRFLEMAAKAIDIIERQHILSSTMRETRKAFLEGAHQAPLSLDNLEEYAAIDGLQPLQHYQDLLEQANFTPESSLRTDTKNEQLLKVKEQAFVIINPTLQVPFSTSVIEDEDDEVRVSGGVVSLFCSLTSQLFVKPKKLQPCGHVFSHEALDRVLRATRVGRTDKCPECGAVVESKEDDEVMTLRVESYKRDEKIMETLKEVQDEGEDEVI